eukprot:15337890-Ditylum_brightwellii.AAC.1
MEHVFPKRAYKTQKNYIQNICKPLLNDYLEFFPVPDRVTATRIIREKFVDVLEDGVPYQWKLDFKKEGFDLSSSTLKEFLDVYVCLEEAELQNPRKKRIAHAIKEHDK